LRRLAGFFTGRKDITVAASQLQWMHLADHNIDERLAGQLTCAPIAQIDGI
jgi:hypothetical protein